MPESNLPKAYLNLMKSQASGRRKKRIIKNGGLWLKPIKRVYHKVKDYITHHGKKLIHNIKYKFKNNPEEEVRRRPVNSMADLKKVKEDMIRLGVIADPELKKIHEPRHNQPFPQIPENEPILQGDGKYNKLSKIQKISNKFDRRLNLFMKNPIKRRYKRKPANKISLFKQNFNKFIKKISTIKIKKQRKRKPLIKQKQLVIEQKPLIVEQKPLIVEQKPLIKSVADLRNLITQSARQDMINRKKTIQIKKKQNKKKQIQIEKPLTYKLPTQRELWERERLITMGLL